MTGHYANKWVRLVGSAGRSSVVRMYACNKNQLEKMMIAWRAFHTTHDLLNVAYIINKDAEVKISYYCIGCQRIYKTRNIIHVNRHLGKKKS